MAVQVEGIKIDTSVLDRITENLRPGAARIVETTGWKIAGDAAQAAPVDTGALRNSILSESGMTDDIEFTVQDGVEYGVFQELGTSKMAAQPFLVPAVEANTQSFNDAFQELFKA